MEFGVSELSLPDRLALVAMTQTGISSIKRMLGRSKQPIPMIF